MENGADLAVGEKSTAEAPPVEKCVPTPLVAYPDDSDTDTLNTSDEKSDLDKSADSDRATPIPKPLPKIPTEDEAVIYILCSLRKENYQRKCKVINQVLSDMLLDPLNSSTAQYRKDLEDRGIIVNGESMWNATEKMLPFKYALPHPPHQVNEYDCGIFVLYFMQHWFDKNRPKMSDEPERLENWFKPADIFHKRYEYRRHLDEKANEPERELVNTDGMPEQHGYMESLKESLKRRDEKIAKKKRDKEREIRDELIAQGKIPPLDTTEYYDDPYDDDDDMEDEYEDETDYSSDRSYDNDPERKKFHLNVYKTDKETLPRIPDGSLLTPQGVDSSIGNSQTGQADYVIQIPPDSQSSIEATTGSSPSPDDLLPISSQSPSKLQLTISADEDSFIEQNAKPAVKQMYVKIQPDPATLAVTSYLYTSDDEVPTALVKIHNGHAETKSLPNSHPSSTASDEHNSESNSLVMSDNNIIKFTKHEMDQERSRLQTRNQKHAEQKLSEERYRFILNISPSHIKFLNISSRNVTFLVIFNDEISVPK